MTLLPGEAGERIQCEMNASALSNELDTGGFSTSYEALSYMWNTTPIWGTDIEGPEIVFVGKAKLQLRIRSNLLQALHRLRFKDGPRVLWIDAICINQASLPGRNEQVSGMRYIYRQASRVLVWICDESKRQGRQTLQQIVDLSTTFKPIPVRERSPPSDSTDKKFEFEL